MIDYLGKLQQIHSPVGWNRAPYRRSTPWGGANLELSGDRADPVTHAGHPDPIVVSGHIHSQAIVGDLEAHASAVTCEEYGDSRLRTGMLAGVLDRFERTEVDR